MARLQALAARDAHIALAPLPTHIERTPLRRDEAVVPLQAPSVYTARFDRRWTIGSFSALVRSLGSVVTSPAPVAEPRPADDEWPMAEVLAGDAVSDTSPGGDLTATVIPSRAHVYPGLLHLEPPPFMRAGRYQRGAIANAVANTHAVMCMADAMRGARYPFG